MKAMRHNQETIFQAKPLATLDIAMLNNDMVYMCCYIIIFTIIIILYKTINVTICQRTVAMERKLQILSI